MDVVSWLLEEDAPGVELLTRLRLLGASPTSRRAAAARRRCCDYSPVARMLERVDEAIAAGDYQKYRGAYWTLIFLAEMQADGGDRRLRRLVAHVLATQLPSGGFAPEARPGWEIVCLTANLLRSLVRLGYGDEPAVARGFRRLAERIVPQGGVPCRIIDDHTLLTSCKMTLPQTLRAVAVAPAGLPRGQLDRLRRILTENMLEVRIYRYVRPDAGRFYDELVPLRPKGVTFKALKAEYLDSHQETATELLPKRGWLRFGFPHSYNSDLLEAMLALAEAGVDHDPAMDEALDHIESKRDRHGRWKMDDSLNGKMLADVERKGAPSKWITLHALMVLKHFRRVEF